MEVIRNFSTKMKDWVNQHRITSASVAGLALVLAVAAGSMFYVSGTVMAQQPTPTMPTTITPTPTTPTTTPTTTTTPSPTTPTPTTPTTPSPTPGGGTDDLSPLEQSFLQRFGERLGLEDEELDGFLRDLQLLIQQVEQDSEEVDIDQIVSDLSEVSDKMVELEDAVNQGTTAVDQLVQQGQSDGLDLEQVATETNQVMEQLTTIGDMLKTIQGDVSEINSKALRGQNSQQSP